MTDKHKSRARIKSDIVIEIIGIDKWRELIKKLGGHMFRIPVRSHEAGDIIERFFDAGIKDRRLIALKANCSSSRVKEVMERLQLQKHSRE
jgi:hypothetical protein